MVNNDVVRSTRAAGSTVPRHLVLKACDLMDHSERGSWAFRLAAQRRLAIVVAVGIAIYSIGPTVVPIANRLLVTWIAHP